MKITSHHLMITSLVFRSNLRLIPLLLLFLGYSRGMPHVLRFGKNLFMIRYHLCGCLTSRNINMIVHGEMTCTRGSIRWRHFIPLALCFAAVCTRQNKQKIVLMSA